MILGAFNRCKDQKTLKVIAMFATVWGWRGTLKFS